MPGLVSSGRAHGGDSDVRVEAARTASTRQNIVKRAGVAEACHIGKVPGDDVKDQTLNGTKPSKGGGVVCLVHVRNIFKGNGSELKGAAGADGDEEAPRRRGGGLSRN